MKQHVFLLRVPTMGDEWARINLFGQRGWRMHFNSIDFGHQTHRLWSSNSMSLAAKVYEFVRRSATACYDMLYRLAS